MEFLQLPIEIITTIITFAIPEGIEALALTCKLLYALSAPFFKDHAEHKKTYGDFCHHIAISGKYIGSAVELLLAIAKDARIARYIQKAILTTDGRFEQGSRVQVDEETSQLLIGMFSNSLYLKRANLNPEDYLATLERQVLETEKGYSDHAATFLLTLLPNVKEIWLPCSLKCHPNPLLETIIKNTVSEWQISPPSLGMTRDVRQYYAMCVPELRERPGSIDTSIFMALPRINSFFVDHHYANKYVNTLAPYQTVQTFILQYSFVEPRAVYSILDCLPNLKLFHYTHDYNNRRPRKWNVSEFMLAVIDSVGLHLEDLSITCMNPWHNSDELVMDSFIGTEERIPMENFQKLRRFRYPLELLYATGTSLRSTKDILCGEILVPPSVINLTIETSGSDAENTAVDLLLHFLIAGMEKYELSLQEISIQGNQHGLNHVHKRFDWHYEKMKDMGIDVMRREWGWRGGQSNKSKRRRIQQQQ